MSQLVTYEELKKQIQQIKDYLDMRYWQIDTGNKKITAKARYSNIGADLTVEGLQDLSNFNYGGSAVTIPASGVNSSTPVTISGGENVLKTPSEIVFNTTAQVKVNVGGSYVKVSTGAGNDSVNIAEGVEGVTVYSGNGTDTITNNNADGGHIYQVKGTGGNKFIQGCSIKDTIQIIDDATVTPQTVTASAGSVLPITIGSATVSVQGNTTSYGTINILNAEGAVLSGCNTSKGYVIKDNDVTLSGGNATVSGSYCKVTGSGSADRIENHYNYVTIDGGNGNDSVYSYGDYCSIVSGNSVNYIYCGGDHCDVSITSNVADNTVNVDGDYCTVTGGSEYTTKFIVSGSNNTINAGNGNNFLTISAGAANNTLTAGYSNDTYINNGAGNIFYFAGNTDGNDSITGWTSNDLFFINNAASTISADSTIVGGHKINFKRGNFSTTANIIGVSTGQIVKVQFGASNPVRHYKLGTGFID